MAGNSEVNQDCSTIPHVNLHFFMIIEKTDEKRGRWVQTHCPLSLSEWGANPSASLAQNGSEVAVQGGHDLRPDAGNVLLG